MISRRTFYSLYNANSPNNPRRHVGSFEAKLVLRNLSCFPAYFLAQRGISANAVTGASFLFFTLAIVSLVIPGGWGIAAFLILHEIGLFLDCIDGQLARFHGTHSPVGRTLDRFMHAVCAGLFPLTLGFRFFSQAFHPWFLLLGGIGTAAFLLDAGWPLDDREHHAYSDVNTRSLIFRTRRFLRILDEHVLLVILVWIFSFFPSSFSVFHGLIFFSLFVSVLFLSKVGFRITSLLLMPPDTRRFDWKGETP